MLMLNWRRTERNCMAVTMPVPDGSIPRKALLICFQLSMIHSRTLSIAWIISLLDDPGLVWNRSRGVEERLIRCPPFYLMQFLWCVVAMRQAQRIQGLWSAECKFECIFATAAADPSSTSHIILQPYTLAQMYVMWIHCVATVLCRCQNT